MWKRVFDTMMSRLIRTGELRVTYPDGATARYGPGGGLRAGMQITDDTTLQALCRNPELAFGEGYMAATVTAENDDLDTLIRLLLRNRSNGNLPVWVKGAAAVRYWLRDVMLRNTAHSARANVAHHYDISDDFYRLFLDRDLQYSCAYFSDPDMTLEEAQSAKKAHIAAKLRIEPGMRVLDIGCGWGGMALTLARTYGAQVTGVTLSENQLVTAQARARAEGLDRLATFRLTDYRDLHDRFDRIVSVGMLEHVGVPHYGTYFEKVADLLAPDGVALIHTIGRCAPPMAQSQWLNKYIFPGGYVPSLSELAPALERAGLWQLDIEVWRLHYATTLRHWRDRFDENQETVQQMYDDRFVRMWRYYLTICILAFEEQPQGVYQFQLGHRRDAVPLTRDYIYSNPGRRVEAAE